MLSCHKNYKFKLFSGSQKLRYKTWPGAKVHTAVKAPPLSSQHGAHKAVMNGDTKTSAPVDVHKQSVCWTRERAHR